MEVPAAGHAVCMPWLFRSLHHSLTCSPLPPPLTPSQELLEKCHPLGMFDSIATLAVAANMRELYRLVLVDTPLAPYFAETLSSEDLDEMNIEILRNTLYKVGRSGGAPRTHSYSAC